MVSRSPAVLFEIENPGGGWCLEGRRRTQSISTPLHSVPETQQTEQISHVSSYKEWIPVHNAMHANTVFMVTFAYISQ